MTQGKQQQVDNTEQIIIENTTEDYEDEFAVVVGIGPISPFLHRDMEILEQEKQQYGHNRTCTGNSPSRRTNNLCSSKIVLIEGTGKMYRPTL